MNLMLGSLVSVAIALLSAGTVLAVDVPTFAKIMTARDLKLFKIVIKPSPPSTPLEYPLPPGLVPGEDPTVSDVSDVSVFVYNGVGGTLTDPLIAGLWDALGSDPMNPKGYKYKNTVAPAGGPVKMVIVKPTVIKILAKDDGTLLLGPLGTADVGVSLVVGSHNYCAGSADGIEKLNEIDRWKYTDNPAPVTCPSP